MTPSCIYSDGPFRVIFQPGPRDTLVISFNEMTFGGDGLRFWGDEFLRKEGYAALGFVSGGPTWFPAPTVAPVLPFARVLAGHYRTVIAYGHSMGGYAALKYSAALGAGCALAFCPQWSIDPADVGGFDTRYARYFDPARNVAMRIGAEDLCSRTFVLHDPAVAVDGMHVGRIPASQVAVPLSGHETVRVFTEAGTVRDLLERCAAPSVTAAELRQVARWARRRSPTYRRHLNERLGQLAIAGWSRAMQAGAFPQAVTSIDRVLAHRPDSGFLRLHAVQALLACGDAARARTELEQAARASDASTIQDRIKDFRTLLAANGQAVR